MANKIQSSQVDSNLVGGVITDAATIPTLANLDTIPIVDDSDGVLKKVSITSLGDNYFDERYPIYDREDHVLTATGFDGTVTTTAHFRETGKLIHMQIENFTGTSNANTFTLTGVPANLRTSVNRCIALVRATDGGLTVNAWMTPPDNSGVITITRLDGAVWGAAGTKGLTLFNGITYLKDWSDI